MHIPQINASKRKAPARIDQALMPVSTGGRFASDEFVCDDNSELDSSTVRIPAPSVHGFSSTGCCVSLSILSVVAILSADPYLSRTNRGATGVVE